MDQRGKVKITSNGSPHSTKVTYENGELVSWGGSFLSKVEIRPIVAGGDLVEAVFTVCNVALDIEAHPALPDQQGD